MYIKENGTNYTLYIKDNYYSNLIGKLNEASDSNDYAQVEAIQKEMNNGHDGGLQNYIDKIVAQIPELKDKKDLVTAIQVLPDNIDNTVKQAINGALETMQSNGESENLLKHVIGIVSMNYTFSGNREWSGGTMTENNYASSYSYDIKSLQSTIAKMQNIYGNDNEISQGIGRFDNILNKTYSDLIYNLQHPQWNQNSSDKRAKHNITDASAIDSILFAPNNTIDTQQTMQANNVQKNNATYANNQMSVMTLVNRIKIASS